MNEPARQFEPGKHPALPPPPGSNPLIVAAHPLLVLSQQIRSTVQHPNPATLREELARAITQFDADAGVKDAAFAAGVGYEIDAPMSTIALRCPVHRPSQADMSCTIEPSKGGNEAKSPICGVLALRNSANADR